MMALASRDRTLGELLAAEAQVYANLSINDLTLDSRQVTPGSAFVAVAGGREHGARYASEALARGAAIVLYEPDPAIGGVPTPSLAVPNLKARLGALARSFYSMTSEPALIGVTGTNGKTTVAYLLAQALTRPDRACGYIGTLGYGLPSKLRRHELTTPDTLTLHRELAELDVPSVAMEVSSHALAQERVAGLRFHTAVFTNLTRDHLDAHGDLAAYGDAKRKLFRFPDLRFAVINADDAFGATLGTDLPTGCELVRTSLKPSGDLTASIRRGDLGGLDLDIAGRFGAARLRSKLIGAFNAENLLAALGAMLAQGVSLPIAVEALSTARPAPGRMEVLGGPPNAPWVVIDYAHTPDALHRVLETLGDLVTGDLWCVFGCGGERDRGKRSIMGAVAADLADRIVLTDDNPRGEDPAAIVRDIRAGIQHPRIEVIHARRAAIEFALERAAPGDVVLIAGKGHESEQIEGLKRRPFNDRDVAAEILGMRP